MISKKLANHPVQDSRVPLPVFREGATVSLPGHGLTVDHCVAPCRIRQDPDFLPEAAGSH